MKNLNGRRALRAELQARMRLIPIDANNSARFVKMAPRALRREKQGKDFRPVYGHAIPAPNHAYVISVLRRGK